MFVKRIKKKDRNYYYLCQYEGEKTNSGTIARTSTKYSLGGSVPEAIKSINQLDIEDKQLYIEKLMKFIGEEREAAARKLAEAKQHFQLLHSIV